MRLSTCLKILVLCAAMVGCSEDQNTSEVAGRGTPVSASTLKERCDSASTELSESTKRLGEARLKAERQSQFLKQCESEGFKPGPCRYEKMDRSLLDADVALTKEIATNKQAQDKKSNPCIAAYNSAQGMSKSSPAKVPSSGCYVFRGSKVVTVDGRQFKFGDGISSVPIFIEPVVNGPTNEGTRAVVRIRPKVGASRCKQFVVVLSASELFYPTHAEVGLCNQQCGQEATAGATSALGSPADAASAAVGACFKSKQQGFLYKDQFKSAKLLPAGTESSSAGFLVGSSQTYYAHRVAGNMVFATVKTGSFRGSEGWLDRAEIGASLESDRVACPK